MVILRHKLIIFGGVVRKGLAFSIEPGKNAARSFKKHARGILDIAERWKDIATENMDFRDVITGGSVIHVSHI